MKLVATIAISTILAIMVGWCAHHWGVTPSDLRLSVASSPWHPLVHLENNSFIMWRSDHLLLNLSHLVFGESSSSNYPLIGVSTALFFLGIFIEFLQRYSYKVASGMALLITSALYLCFGLDTVVWDSILWLPWYALSLKWALTSEKNPALSTLVVFGLACRIALSANQFGWLATLVALETARATLAPQERNSRVLFLACISLLPSLYVISDAPLPAFPYYPDLARVVPDDGLPGIIRPLVGAEPPLPILNRGILRESWNIPSAILVTVTLALTLLTRRILLLPLIFGGALLFDTMLPESLSQIGPIATLTRIIPGYSSLAITPMVAVLTVITLSLYGVRVLQSWRGLAISFIAAASLLTRSVSYPTSHTLQTPLARLNLPPEILSQKFVDAHPFLVSPSFNVFSSFNYLPLFHPEKTLSESRKIAIPFERLLTQSSPLTDERILKKAFDGSEATRWSPKEGGQRGGEWLTFPLPPTTPLDGIGLLTGPYVTDFPRGLTVTHQPECDGPPEKNELLFSAPHWLGPLKKTDDGYPYFGGEEEVRIPFPHSITGGCLKVEQTGFSESFDWSVTEVIGLQVEGT